MDLSCQSTYYNQFNAKQMFFFPFFLSSVYHSLCKLKMRKERKRERDSNDRVVYDSIQCHLLMKIISQ